MNAQIAVVGAGVMGTGIAQVFAAAGHPVTLYDPDPAARDRAPARIEAGAAVVGMPVPAHVTVTGDLLYAVATADLVIEAGPEDLAVKRALFAELDRLAPAWAVLASNTSAIPIGRIAREVRRPDRVLGTHFWNPPYLVPLVEVVQAARTTLDRVTWTIGLLDRIGMKPVHVAADVPGFVGNRLQHALKREAIALVAAGVCSAETIDTVTRYGFGARLGIVGPLEQSDLSGLGLTLAIHEVLMPYLDRTPGPHPYLLDTIAKGHTGAATGQGFRRWRPGEAEARQAEITRELAAAARRRQLGEES